MIWRILVFMLLAHAAWAQQISGGAGGGGSSSLVIGTTITGCGTSGFVLYNNSSAVGCEATIVSGSSATSGCGFSSTGNFGGVLWNNNGVVNCAVNVLSTDGLSSFRLSSGSGGTYASAQIWDVAGTGNRAVFIGGASFGIVQYSTARFAWNSSASGDVLGSIDTTLCRQGVGIVEIGSGTGCGASGSLLTTNITASGANVLFSGINATTETDMLCFNTSTGLVTHSTVAQQCTVSDANLKQEITPIDPRRALAVVTGFDPIEFHYRPEADMGSDLHMGFTMQRVASIEPKLATPNGIKYGELSPWLVAAIQQLKAEIDALKAAK